MSVYSRSAVYDVINYLWENLKESKVLDPTDYYLDDFESSIVPIIPIQDQPELANHLNNKPYIIYDFIGYPQTNDEIFINEEAVMFTIFCPNFSKVMEIVRVFNESFRGKDEAAKKLQLADTTSGDFFFYSTRIDGIDISGQASKESGRITGEVTVCYKYGEPLDWSGNYLV